jgi:hypothetical protein
MTTFTLVQVVNDRLIETTFDEANVIPAMDARGFPLVGLNHNPRQRTELQGQPRFAGLCGPMWNAGGIRYEAVDAYERLSA